MVNEMLKLPILFKTFKRTTPNASQKQYGFREITLLGRGYIKTTGYNQEQILEACNKSLLEVKHGNFPYERWFCLRRNNMYGP